MIPKGYLSCKEFVGKDVSVYLSHEIDDFIKCKNKKKIIFILPIDLRDVELNYDLFVNHESFGEMDIDTVNKYINQISKKMKKDSIIFLVNRLSRNVDNWSINTSHLTNFFDYNLTFFDKLLMKIDNFRNIIPRQQHLPNVIYIERKK